MTSKIENILIKKICEKSILVFNILKLKNYLMCVQVNRITLFLTALQFAYKPNFIPRQFIDRRLLLESLRLQFFNRAIQLLDFFINILHHLSLFLIQILLEFSQELFNLLVRIHFFLRILILLQHRLILLELNMLD